MNAWRLHGCVEQNPDICTEHGTLGIYVEEGDRTHCTGIGQVGGNKAKQETKRGYIRRYIVDITSQRSILDATAQIADEKK